MTRAAVPWIIFGLTLIVSPGGAGADEEGLQAAAQILRVSLQEYRFEPSQIVLGTGRTVELTLKNDGQHLHEFITDAFRNVPLEMEIDGVISEVPGLDELEIPPGRRVTLRFMPPGSGEFEIACDAEKPVGHRHAGMIGTLTFR